MKLADIHLDTFGLTQLISPKIIYIFTWSKKFFLQLCWDHFLVDN